MQNPFNSHLDLDLDPDLELSTLLNLDPDPDLDLDPTLFLDLDTSPPPLQPVTPPSNPDHDDMDLDCLREYNEGGGHLWGLIVDPDVGCPLSRPTIEPQSRRPYCIQHLPEVRRPLNNEGGGHPCYLIMDPDAVCPLSWPTTEPQGGPHSIQHLPGANRPLNAMEPQGCSYSIQNLPEVRRLSNAMTCSNINLKLVLQKKLTITDVGSARRILLPKDKAEANLPLIGTEGIILHLEDWSSHIVWHISYRFWENSKTRRYFLENADRFLQYHNLKDRDYLILYHNIKDEKYIIKGVKAEDYFKGDPVVAHCRLGNIIN